MGADTDCCCTSCCHTPASPHDPEFARKLWWIWQGGPFGADADASDDGDLAQPSEGIGLPCAACHRSADDETAAFGIRFPDP
jgi:hypothetical protein